ncbi:uncharacterized protein F5891DRAFT_982021 [Suillus fuscotomentosus]|uniref:Uncharacterized protein n=1 Tax=Suillus fuscotomentosus TaxID=1912939 RepID=A0AAD4HJ10_9AGAM|nr:uncharacterized protein F5891DRAFT_982021 [Suillus fuscotomentosus]KAG1898393.1 hypothetical protein F5891DRAFT_982021 [Suillus fuscotomentosus]
MPTLSRECRSSINLCHMFKLNNLNIATQHSQQYVAGLLDRTFGIWPMQLPRYAELVMLTNGHEDYLVPMRRINDPALVTFAPRKMPAWIVWEGWEELVHPLGGTYYYHTKKASTGRLYKQCIY